MIRKKLLSKINGQKKFLFKKSFLSKKNLVKKNFCEKIWWKNFSQKSFSQTNFFGQTKFMVKQIFLVDNFLSQNISNLKRNLVGLVTSPQKKVWFKLCWIVVSCLRRILFTKDWEGLTLGEWLVTHMKIVGLKLFEVVVSFAGRIHLQNFIPPEWFFLV